MRTRWVTVIGVALAAAILSGCASSDKHEIHDLNRRLVSLDLAAKRMPDETYIVDPPDSIRVEFLTEPSANRDVNLRSDGCVTLPYLEDVHVAGLTTIQIREKLEKLYERYYNEPRILVTVTGYRSKSIFIYGEVGRQGAIPYTGTQTVADVIGQVGGVSNYAATWRVRVIRGDAKDPEIYKVNLVKLLYEGDTLQNVSLAENDVIRVPPTWLAWIGYRIDELLFPFRSVIAAVSTGRTLTGTNLYTANP